MHLTFLDVYQVVLVKKQGRLHCSIFVLLLHVHMKAFIYQKLMLCTYCCVRELGRSYSQLIIGIANYRVSSEVSRLSLGQLYPQSYSELSELKCGYPALPL